jgi:hypothetical protein
MVALARHQHYLPVPAIDIIKTLLVCDIVNEYNGISIMNVSFEHLSGYGSTVNVPKLQRHINISHELQALLKEVNAYGLLVVATEVIITVPVDQLSLTNCGIS